MSPATTRKRTRTGCLTCRARRIKCDETGAVCGNCSRSGLECLRSAGGESLSQAERSRMAADARDGRLTQAATARRRVKRSCTACKGVKKRCDGGRPRCERCAGRGLPCAYDCERASPRASAAAPSPTYSFSPPSSLSSMSPLSSAAPAGTLDLPDRALAEDLCDAFFDEIAPLRCLGFLHRHTFLQQARDCSLEDHLDPLLLSVCALATKTIRKRDLWERGCAWARAAQGLVLAELHEISVRRLMCVVILYEHASRVGEHRLCFMLSGLASRFSQALSLNLEHDHDVLSESGMPAVEREARRRVMWACYIIDSVVACGLSHVQAIDTTTIRIQLPCDDKFFLYKMPRRTATVPIRFDAPAASERKERLPTENQDTHAFQLRLFLIRDQILRYISDRTDEKDPWRLTTSLADLQEWKESLPPELQLNSDVIAVRREQSMLSALVALHVQYHQINCLFFRCTIPSMLFPARAQTGLSQNASSDFMTESQRGWFEQACAMTTVFGVALEHSPVSMADPSIGPSAYNAIIIKFLYLTNFVPLEERLATLETVLPLVNVDLRFLRELCGYHPSVSFACRAAEHLAEEARTKIAEDPTVKLSESGNPLRITSFPTDSISLDHRTNPLSTIGQMRRELEDVHAPDRAAVPLSRDGHSPGEPERLWTWI